MITRILEQLEQVAITAAATLALAMITALVWFPAAAEAQQQDTYYKSRAAAPAAVEAAPNNADRRVAEPVGDDRRRVARRPAPEQSAAAATSRVVEPGDTIWSISRARLGSGAPPEQVSKEVERIVELNRDRIRDPDLITPGQELSLVPVETTKLAGVVVNRTPPEPVAAAQPLAETKPAASVVAEPVTLPPDLPDLPEVEPAFEAREVYAPVAPVVVDERRLLGWGLILLSLGVAAVTTWRVVTEVRRYL